MRANKSTSWRRLPFRRTILDLTAAVALTYPATQLFLERAMASGARFELSDANVAIVAGICQKLDGVALAIELAAGRVEAYGLEQTAALLDQRLSLLWQGQRTAPPRQKTLQATLDWSYGLLSEVERLVLRRLAVFVGYFTIEAALEVVTDAKIDRALLFGAMDSLVAKSMVAPRPIGAMMRYRLLDTTRAYLLETGVDDAALAARHAIYYQRWLEQTGAEWPTLSNAAERAPHFASLHNVRAALEWCFGANGDTEIGIKPGRCGRAGLSGDVSAYRMSSLVEAGNPRDRRRHARQRRGDAYPGGSGIVADVHARQQRSWHAWL